MSPGSPDWDERLSAIGRHLAQGDHDLVLLTELWLEGDHILLREALDGEYSSTSFQQLAGNGCRQDILAPKGCSGTFS